MESWSTLDEKILEQILSHIPVQELMTVQTLVCRKWYKVITKPHFLPWKKAYLQYKLNPRLGREAFIQARLEKGSDGEEEGKDDEYMTPIPTDVEEEESEDEAGQPKTDANVGSPKNSQDSTKVDVAEGDVSKEGNTENEKDDSVGDKSDSVEKQKPEDNSDGAIKKDEEGDEATSEDGPPAKKSRIEREEAPNENCNKPEGDSTENDADKKSSKESDEAMDVSSEEKFNDKSKDKEKEEAGDQTEEKSDNTTSEQSNDNKNEDDDKKSEENNGDNKETQNTKLEQDESVASNEKGEETDKSAESTDEKNVKTEPMDEDQSTKEASQSNDENSDSKKPDENGDESKNGVKKEPPKPKKKPKTPPPPPPPPKKVREFKSQVLNDFLAEVYTNGGYEGDNIGPSFHLHEKVTNDSENQEESLKKSSLWRIETDLPFLVIDFFDNHFNLVVNYLKLFLI